MSTIGPVQIDRGRQSRIIINGLRIANAPGAVHPYFATAKQVIVTGGIDSFWGGKIRVGRIDIVEPHLYFEIYPAGAKLTHNFPHWNSGPQSRYEIYHLDLGKLYVTRGAFELLDRRHTITAAATDITLDDQRHVDRGSVRRRSQQPAVHAAHSGLRADPRRRCAAQFRFTPDNLALQSVALEGGNDLRVFVERQRRAAQRWRRTTCTSPRRSDSNRVREIFKVNKVLDGIIDLDGTLRGKGGTMTLAGGWLSPKISADAYDLTNVHGTMNVTGDRAIVDVQRATYGGGNIAAHYTLPTYAEPYPMSVDLRYNGVSLEKLFNDWGIKDTGLRGGATGHLAYHWEQGHACSPAPAKERRRWRRTRRRSRTRRIRFRSAARPTSRSTTAWSRSATRNSSPTRRTIDFTGKFRIEDAWTDLLMKIHSSDFAELDRIGYNFAHSAGKNTYTLLGLGGSGDITGNVRGKIKAPEVVARIASSGTKYNNVLLGDCGDRPSLRRRQEPAHVREGHVPRRRRADGA